MALAACVVIVVAAALLWPRGRVSEAEAVQIARSACEEHGGVPRDCPVKVKLERDRYTVTFVWVPPNEDTFGPDYHAEVTLDAKTGKIVEILGPN